jgi:LacI family transcriptional regulator
MVCGTPTDPIAGAPRLEGYVQALQASGIEHRDDFVTYGDFGFHTGLAAAEQLLDQARDVTAVFAASDEMAIAVLSVAHRRGMRVPDDLSVIGYDNTLMAEMANPPLTTVAQPLYEMGLEAGQLLFQMIRDKTELPGRSVEHTIVERNTVKIL